MKKIMAIALAAMLVIGCSFSAWATTVDDNPAGTTVVEIKSGDTMSKNNGTVQTNNGTVNTNTDTGTIQTNGNTGIVGTNNGEMLHNLNYVNINDKTIRKNWASGTVATNNGTVEENQISIDPFTEEILSEGKITTNNGTVNTNNGTVNTNTDTGTIQTNGNYGTIENNCGKVVHNEGTVETNNAGGIVEKNDIGATVEINNGRIGTGDQTDNNLNFGTVTTNTLTGIVKMANTQAAVVTDNYGEVENATVDSNGKLVFGSDTYYGVTYYDEKSKISNEQAEANTKITIKTAEKDGYKLVKWEVTTPAGLQSYYYTVGQEVDVTSPLQLQAVWEAIQQAQAKSSGGSSGGSGSWSSTPTTYGSSSSPITTGAWKKNTDGTFTLSMNGDKLLNSRAWVTYTGTDGKQYTGCFYFDKNGVMATGWKQIDGKWYYFDETEGNAKGMMQTNTTTPDGYKVDANGQWIEKA